MTAVQGVAPMEWLLCPQAYGEEPVCISSGKGPFNLPQRPATNSNST